jgi:hypothetical protein
MDNTETLAISGTQENPRGNKEWTIQRHWQYQGHKKTQAAIKNGQYRDTGNIRVKNVKKKQGYK